MKEDLLRYMEKRAEKLSPSVESGGPVVTISREKGCPANSIADKLAKELSKSHDKDWRWVNRDILRETANDLHMNESKINHILYSEDKGFFRDLMLSFGERYYESDVMVKKTLAELISEFTSSGKVIVVGLGGAAITKSVDKALHVKLYAPYKQRLQKVMEMENMDSERAREYMDETDVNRKMLLDYYNGFRAGDDLFHAQFNSSLMSESEIVKSIIQLMQTRNIIH